MLKGYKYRIYLTPEQEEEFNIQNDGVRFVYNLALETKINAWKYYNKSIPI